MIMKKPILPTLFVMLIATLFRRFWGLLPSFTFLSKTSRRFFKSSMVSVGIFSITKNNDFIHHPWRFGCNFKWFVKNRESWHPILRTFLVQKIWTCRKTMQICCLNPYSSIPSSLKIEGIHLIIQVFFPVRIYFCMIFYSIPCSVNHISSIVRISAKGLLQKWNILITKRSAMNPLRR